MRKNARLFLALILALLLISGLTVSLSSPVQAESKTFTYAIGGDTGNTINPMTADDRWSLMVTHLTFSPAYYINPDGSVTYILAKSFEASEDGLSYTMKLKDNLKWSDGEPLTADDIVYTYDEINKKGDSMFIDGKPIELTKEDDHTVIFKLPAVSASVFEMLVSETGVLPKHFFEKRNGFDVNMLEEELVGSGPYVLKKYETGQYLKFEKNPNYANEPAKIDTVILRIIESPDTASLALQNGEIDAWIGLPDMLDSFKDNEAFHINNYSEGRVAYLRLNPMTEAMQNKDYRAGLLYALDRNEIMLAGYTDPDFFKLSYSFLPSSNEYYSEDLEKNDQDLEKARKLTADGPRDLKLAYIEEDKVQANQVLAIQAQLKKIDINVELVGMNQAAYMSAAYDNENKDYDILMGGYVMGVDPNTFSMLFVQGQMNMMNYHNETVDKLFNEGNATLDKEKRHEIYNELQKVIADEAIFYPFGGNLRTLVTSARVGGLEDAIFAPVYTFADWSKLTISD